jgi:hypothetical protein
MNHNEALFVAVSQKPGSHRKECDQPFYSTFIGELMATAGLYKGDCGSETLCATGAHKTLMKPWSPP